MTLHNVLAQVMRLERDVQVIVSLVAGDDFIAPIGSYYTTASSGEPDQAILADLADGFPFRATKRGWESPSVQLLVPIRPSGLMRRALQRGLIHSTLDNVVLFLTSGKAGHVKACLTRKGATKPVFELVGTSTLFYSHEEEHHASQE